MQCELRQYIDRKNYNTIDLFKFICSILVIMIHVKPFGKAAVKGGAIDLLNFWIKNYGARIAVPFFFIAAGFFLYKKTTLNDFDVTHSKRYVIRVLRLYLVWTIIYIPLIYLKFFQNKTDMTYAVLFFIREAIFKGSYNHLWYLPALAVAVVLVSYLLKKRLKPQTIVITAGLLYFMGLFAQSWFGFIKPLELHAPVIWTLLKLIEKIIVTTRDGLFDGFLFVSIGMCFAYYDLRLSRKQAAIGFAVSMLAMFAEVFTLKRLDYIREYDMYLFLVPASFFLFHFAMNTNLPDSPAYKQMRKMSSLIFYSHLWVKKVVSVFLTIACKPMAKSWLLFILTVVVTIAFSYAVIFLSERKGFRWLKVIYT